MKRAILLSVLAFALVFIGTLAWKLWPELTRPKQVDPAVRIPSPLELASIPTASHFDFPLGNENGAMAYNTQHFTENKHLGDDLTGSAAKTATSAIRFTRSPTVAYCWQAMAVRDGATLSFWCTLASKITNGNMRNRITGHVQDMLVHPGETVQCGQQISTVGTANGRYLAHLHFEMREFLTPFVGPGYREDTRGWINPTKFIEDHR